jgi:hypothetical protein
VRDASNEDVRGISAANEVFQVNGRELEQMLRLIDANIGSNQTRLRSEIIHFIESHEDVVLDQLRAHESAVIPTSFGEIVLDLADLREAVA